MKKVVLIILLAALASVVGLGIWLFADLPSLDALSAGLLTPSVRITDRNGTLLYEMISPTGGRHAPVAIESIPLALQQATISTEDASFYQNPGVDVGGIVRAFWINLRGGETLSGGSTITQQIARNTLMQPEERNERTLRRKLRESWLAWRLSRRYTKDEILGLYLNQSYYGGLAYGVEAAAQTYFGKPVSELDLAESALLAGLTQAPGLYNPFSDFEAAKERQLVVLGLMEKHHFISAEQRQLAAAEKLVLASTPYPIEAPHFVLWVAGQLEEILPPEALHGSQNPGGYGLVVRTTLDLSWQRRAEDIACRQIETLNIPPAGGEGHNVHNAALVALDPNSGEILAMLGSADYFDPDISGAVNMALAPRQPGSALKPVIYAAALDPNQPVPWTPATMLLDVRTSFATHEGQPYVPANYDLQEHGPVLVREALASSLNIPAVIALDHVGLEQAIGLSADLGIT
ncbi:MAG: penicillin-binding protein, partial [Chloroflexota bacterium]